MVGKTVFELWLFGGNSNNGSNCGLAYANSNNAWSNSNANYSARLTTLIGSYAEKMIRVSVLRHGKAPEYREPRQRVTYVEHVLGRNNIHLARIWVSPSARDVSKPQGFESFTQRR